MPAAAAFLNRLHSRVESARDHLLKTQLAQAAQINKRRTQHTFSEGDLVLLSTKDLNLAYPTKFTPKFLGPFRVIAVRDNAVRLALPRSLEHLHPVISTNRVRPFHERDLALGPSAYPQPPPAFSDADQDYFTIERIIAQRQRMRRGRPELQYRIRWDGYPPEDDTWLKADFLRNEPGGPESIAAWRARMQAIPQPAAQDRAARHRGGVDLDLTPPVVFPRAPVAPRVPVARAPPVSVAAAPPRARPAARVVPPRAAAAAADPQAGAADPDIGIPARVLSDPPLGRGHRLKRPSTQHGRS